MKYIIGLVAALFYFQGISQHQWGPSIGVNTLPYLFEDKDGEFEFEGEIGYNLGVNYQYLINNKLGLELSACFLSTSYERNIDQFTIDGSGNIRGLNVTSYHKIVGINPSIQYGLLISKNYRLNILTGLLNQIVLSHNFDSSGDFESSNFQRGYYKNYLIGQSVGLSHLFNITESHKIEVLSSIGFYYIRVHQELFESVQPMFLSIEARWLFYRSERL